MNSGYPLLSSRSIDTFLLISRSLLLLHATEASEPGSQTDTADCDRESGVFFAPELGRGWSLALMAEDD